MIVDLSSLLPSLGSVSGNPTNDIDYHAWCVDEKGIVCDEGVELLDQTDRSRSMSKAMPRNVVDAKMSFQICWHNIT
jgi:hypothetical protein